MTAMELSSNFPNWEIVIPKEFESLVGVTVGDSHRRVEFIFYPNKILLKTESPEAGNSIEEVNCAF